MVDQLRNITISLRAEDTSYTGTLNNLFGGTVDLWRLTLFPCLGQK